jgi:hypothetical protein
MRVLGKATQLRETWLPILLVTGFISLRWLLNSNMGLFNEANMLPFARQHIDPSWIAQDWYLNQPPGYRVPFINVFGRMAAAWGFLATSILGRLLCYTFIASALVNLSRKLKLSTPLLLLAIALFLYVNTGTSGAAGDQGAAAREWLVGGVEPKMVTYGLILYAIGCLLSDRLLPAALLLGFATTFHTLVGGWAFLCSLAWLVLLRRGLLFGNLRRFGLFFVLYVAASLFAIQPILEQIATPKSAGRFPPSFIYVYLRTPHHLNPLAWEAGWWLKPVILLLILGLSIYVLQRYAKKADPSASQPHLARVRLATFTLVSLIPYAIGLIIAPFDQQGKLLQYYLFRFGDLMLPLNTCLLFACALEQSFSEGRSRKTLTSVCFTLLSLTCALQAVTFSAQAFSLQDFPHDPQEIDAEGKEMTSWIRLHTPKTAIFVSPPVDLASFSWLSERATVAKFKLVPPTAAGVAVWLERLTDLSGKVDPWTEIKRTKDNSISIGNKLTKGYGKLTTEEAIALMTKYQAAYFLTSNTHRLNLPIVHRNDEYTLYARK